MENEAKKVLFLFFHNYSGVGKGISNKVNSQVEAWRSLAYKVDFLTVINGRLQIGEKEVYTGSNNIIIRLLAPLLSIIYIKDKYDITFIRSFGLDPMTWVFLKLAKYKLGKVVYEIPTFPYEKELIDKGFIGRMYAGFEKLFANRMARQFSLIVNYNGYSTVWNRPALNFSNAIDLESIKFTGFSRKDSRKEFHLLGVANVRPAHGFDRIIAGIALYQSTKSPEEPEVYFHMVGTGEHMPLLSRMVHDNKIEDKIIFYGELYDDQLTEVFLKCHLAAGALNMSRINLKTGSVLKVREYFARGIPSIISYDDIALRGFEKFYCSIPDNEEPVNIKYLLKWFDNISFSAMELRAIAQREFSWAPQFMRLANIK